MNHYVLILRYFIDLRWLKQWKKYVGYDTEKNCLINIHKFVIISLFIKRSLFSPITDSYLVHLTIVDDLVNMLAK